MHWAHHDDKTKRRTDPVRNPDGSTTWTMGTPTRVRITIAPRTDLVTPIIATALADSWARTNGPSNWMPSSGWASSSASSEKRARYDPALDIGYGVEPVWGTPPCRRPLRRRPAVLNQERACLLRQKHVGLVSTGSGSVGTASGPVLLDPMRYGFLGPETTFTHQALLQALEVMPREFTDTVEQVPFAAVATATTDLLAGEIDALIAPIENSVEGGVSGTLDVLAATDSITIVAEQIVQVTFVLAARAETALDDLRVVSSHPHAQAQVQGWLRENVPGANVATASSTAAAARDLASMSSEEAHGRAAVCSPLAAAHFGLTVLAEQIEDNSGAQTRFVLVTREGRIPARTGADKTTLVVQLPAQPLRRPARDPRDVQQQRREPLPDRIAPLRRFPGPILLLDRRRGAHRGPSRRRLPACAAPDLPRRALPRVVSRGSTGQLRRLARSSPTTPTTRRTPGSRR